VKLIEKRGNQCFLQEVFAAAKAQQAQIDADTNFAPDNLVRKIYDQSTYEEVSEEIAWQVTPPNWNGKLMVLYPSVSTLRQTLGAQRDDACISGDYPETGGLRVLNQALLNYFEQSDARAY